MSSEAAPVGPRAAPQWRQSQRDIQAGLADRRADLPLRYLRQQAHLTAPAANVRLAERALSGAHGVAAELLACYGITPADVARRLDFGTDSVETLLQGGGAPVVVVDLEDGVAPGEEAHVRAMLVDRHGGLSSHFRGENRAMSWCRARADRAPAHRARR